MQRFGRDLISRNVLCLCIFGGYNHHSVFFAFCWPNEMHNGEDQILRNVRLPRTTLTE